MGNRVRHPRVPLMIQMHHETDLSREYNHLGCFPHLQQDDRVATLHRFPQCSSHRVWGKTASQPQLHLRSYHQGVSRLGTGTNDPNSSCSLTGQVHSAPTSQKRASLLVQSPPISDKGFATSQTAMRPAPPAQRE